MQITEAILVGAPWKTDLQLWSTFYSITHPELENIYKVIDLINLAAWQFFFCHHLYEIPFPTTVVNKLLIEEENALHMPFFTGNVLKMCHISDILSNLQVLWLLVSGRDMKPQCNYTLSVRFLETKPGIRRFKMWKLTLMLTQRIGYFTQEHLLFT